MAEIVSRDCLRENIGSLGDASDDGGGGVGVIGIVGTAAMLGYGGWRAASWFRQPPGWPRLLAACVLGWVWLTVGLQIVGLIGVLNAPAVLVWSAAGAAIAIGLRPSQTLPSPIPERWGVLATVALGLTIAAAANFAAVSILVPPRIYSDGPIYHLFFAAKWWKAGKIFLIASPFGENAATYFPANGDLLFAGLMSLYGGDRPARVGQAPFLLMASIASYGIARRVGASAGSAIVAACLFATSLPLLLFAFEANVDAIFVGGYLAAVAFGLRYALDGGDVRSLILAGLAAGGAWGTKPTATAFLPPLVLMAVFLVARRFVPPRCKLAHLGAAAAALVVPCGFWFGRSLILTGNPLYPMHVEVFGRVLLRGWYRSAEMQRSQFYLPIGDWRSFGSIVFMVCDARLAPLWVLSLVGAWSWGRSRSLHDRATWMLAGLAVLNVAIYWLAIPYRTQQRFMLQAVGLAAAPVALVLDRGRAWRLAAVVLLVVHLVTSQAWPWSVLAPANVRPPWELSTKVPQSAAAPMTFPSSREDFLRYWRSPGGIEILAILGGTLIGSLAVAGAWAFAARAPSRGRIAGASAASVALLVAVAVAMEGTSPYPPSRLTFPRFDDYQRGWLALDHLSPSEGTRVAYAGTNLPYYLMVGGLRNDVFYVNVDSHPDWQMHDYHLSAAGRGDPSLWNSPRPGWDRIHPDYPAWLRNLRGQKIRLLVVARANSDDGLFNIADAESFPIERVWADVHPEAFELVYPRVEPDPKMRIYRVVEK